MDPKGCLLIAPHTVERQVHSGKEVESVPPWLPQSAPCTLKIHFSTHSQGAAPPAFSWASLPEGTFRSGVGRMNHSPHHCGWSQGPKRYSLSLPFTAHSNSPYPPLLPLLRKRGRIFFLLPNLEKSTVQHICSISEIHC